MVKKKYIASELRKHHGTRRLRVAVTDQWGNLLDGRWFTADPELPTIEAIVPDDKRVTLVLSRRFCNRCNKMLADISTEPRCENCGGVEFRLALPLVELRRLERWADEPIDEQMAFAFDEDRETENQA